MSEDDDGPVIVLCTAVANDPNPPVPSVVRVCDRCGAPVWVSADLVDELRLLHPKADVDLRCDNCSGSAEITMADGHVSITRGQLAELMRSGIPLTEIVKLMALLEISHAVSPSDPAVEAAMLEMNKFPNGKLADTFVDSCERIAAEIATTLNASN